MSVTYIYEIVTVATLLLQMRKAPCLQVWSHRATWVPGSVHTLMWNSRKSLLLSPCENLNFGLFVSWLSAFPPVLQLARIGLWGEGTPDFCSDYQHLASENFMLLCVTLSAPITEFLKLC